MQSIPTHNTPTILVILGATGDLAKKKIFPALAHLRRHGLIPDQFSLIGVARGALSQNDFHAYFADAASLQSREASQPEDLEEFFSAMSYQSGDFASAETFSALANRIHTIEQAWGVCANKLFYLAVPPAQYEAIFENLARVKLNEPCGGPLGWTRVLIEKPFGHDFESGQELEGLVSRYFKEEQIYRIDHYLAKEIVQGILHFRFSNNLFERAWNNTLIEKIEVRLLETIGVEDRGNFYDSVGALKDVGQNHLLEMLAALTMEYPQDMEASTLRQRRARILETLKPWTERAIREQTFRAQYQRYREIEGVDKHSETETYFSLQTELLHPSWKGVPIFFEAGKRCAEARKEIVVTLKHPPLCLLCEPGHHTQNQVIFQLEPNDQITIKFWTKKPGFRRELEERAFSFFLYEKESRAPYVEEYAKLLSAAVTGDQTLFVVKEEVEALWKFTDPIEEGWKSGIVPLERYEPGTTPQAPWQRSPQPRFEPSPRKEIGMVGLGKMGANLARRMNEKGWRIIGYNRSGGPTDQLTKEGVIEPAHSVQELVEKLPSPKMVWLMVPAGKSVDETLFGNGCLAEIFASGDIVIDGGNSFYKDSIRRAEELEKRGIKFLDVGVSGGPAGARSGPCLMVGGRKEAHALLEPLFRDLALEKGYQFFAGAGAGHFVKMIHNGIEYGMMQAIAEGFTILKHSDYALDLVRAADVYNHGSVIESRLIGWLKEAFELYGADLDEISGRVAHTGEGEWTVATAREQGSVARAIELAYQFRVESEKKPSYTGKVLSVLRNRFGGHPID